MRDQGKCGVCWAFATYGALESALLPEEPRDFSENNLKNLHGFDAGPCDGGFFNLPMAYLARWQGPVDEIADPYSDTDVNSSPPDLPAQKHIQNILVFARRTGADDNITLKVALMTYGGVQAPMYMAETTAFYRSSTASYYHNGAEPSSMNHYVTLAGWDDNYSRANFAAAPPGDGAFLAKNSWGTSWGDKGYFWISYYDTGFAKDGSAVYLTDPEANYTRIYDYDPLGWTNSVGYESPTGWFANIFTSLGDERLQAVSFFTTRPNSAYTIHVYTDVTDGPTAGKLASTQSGTAELPGYHTIVLQTPVTLATGARFSAAVKMTTPGFKFPIPLERALKNYSSRATASPGQSYISADGAAWQDATEAYPTANVCLKAFTGTGGPDLAVTVTHAGSFVQGQGGASFRVIVSNAAGAQSTRGPVTVTEAAPPGLALVSMSGEGWACSAGGNGCSRDDALAGGGSYPAITVMVNVAADATSPQVNSVTVSGGGATSVTASDAVSIAGNGRAPRRRIGREPYPGARRDR